MTMLMNVLATTVGVASLSVGTSSNTKCSVAASPLAFPVYDPFRTENTMTLGTLSFACTNVDTPVIVTIDFSAGGSGSIMSRAMTASGNRLYYNLYYNNNPASVWGDGSIGAHYAATIAPSTQKTVSIKLPILGIVPALQKSVPSAAYSDSVTATATFNY